MATQNGALCDGHTRVSCARHIHFVANEDFHQEVRLLLEGHLLQWAFRQARDVHNLRLINLLPNPPPLGTWLDARGCPFVACIPNALLGVISSWPLSSSSFSFSFCLPNSWGGMVT